MKVNDLKMFNLRGFTVCGRNFYPIVQQKKMAFNLHCLKLMQFQWQGMRLKIHGLVFLNVFPENIEFNIHLVAFS